MVRTRSRVTNPGPQESRDVSNNPRRDHQLAPAMQPSSVQHVQSMAATMAELTRQNQELTRQLNSRRQHCDENVEGHTQSQKNTRNAEPESQLRGTTSQRVPHLEKEMD